MATALLCHIEQFDPAVEQWTQYVERLEQFFVANDVTGEDKKDKRRATFLSVMGRDAYNLLRSLIAPEKPSENSFEELVAVLSEHYSPKPTEVMQRYRFNSRSRKEGESVADYVAQPRKLAEFCNYGNSLDKMLRDRLVWGVKDPSIQKKLLSEPDLTLVRAIQIAQSTETAEKNLREMDSNRESESKRVQYVADGKRQQYGKGKYERTVRTEQRGNSGKECFRCGRLGHNEQDCFHKESVCHNCKGRGHLAAVCRKPKTGAIKERDDIDWCRQEAATCEANHRGFRVG